MRRTSGTIYAFVICLVFVPAAYGQSTFADVAQNLKVKLEKDSVRRGETITFAISFDIPHGWHSYPGTQHPNADDEAPTVKFRTHRSEKNIIVIDEIVEDPIPKEEVLNRKPVWFVTGRATWKRKLIVLPIAAVGKQTIRIAGILPVCTDGDNGRCLYPEHFESEITITDAPPVDVDPKYKDIVDAAIRKMGVAPPPPSPANAAAAASRVVVTEQSLVEDARGVVPPAASLDEHEANLNWVADNLQWVADKPATTQREGLLTFLLSAAFWAGVALVTPCVFPMIPITVSFFLKQSESEHHRPLKTALIYCGTIVIVLGIAALTLLTAFRALSVHPVTNILLGLLFLVFALSLFGMYDITLPSGLARFTSSREGKGGIVGTVFMALTFTIVSFTCVAPFLGGFGGLAQSGNFKTWELVLGAFVFSTTFAAPFFVLAMFPSLIKKLPKSGAWLNAVKVVMGFLEIAAALKFFRTAELRLLPVSEFFTYDLVLGIWVALALLCGLYLLKIFKLPHDHDVEPNIGVVRMLLGLTFIALGIYLTPALFKRGAEKENQRPAGIIYAWVDSFLLPEPSSLPWSVNLKGTIDVARKEADRTGKSQYIFLDNTGVTCTNCQLNENTVFRLQEVREQLLKYRLVQHYTDEVRAEFYPNGADRDRREDEASQNLAFQRKVFKDERLPLYAALEVTKDKVYVRSIYRESKINDTAAFTRFLRDNLKPYQPAVQAAAK